MKVAYFSPLPPNSSGIADYSALLLPALSKLIDVEVVSEPKRRAGKGCDVALYHVGNNPEVHGWIVEALRERPGLVVLHEHVLHHLVAGMTIAVGDHEGYRVAMQRDSGVVGRLLAHGIIDGIVPPVWESRPMDFPLCGEILDLATGLIVHSQTVEQAVLDRGYGGPIFRIPHPAWAKPNVVEDEALVGITGPIFGAFGHLNTAKRVPQLVEAFAQVVATNPKAKLLLVGSASEEIHVDARLAEIAEQYPGSVIRLPYVEEERLWNLIASCDVCVCLRYPTMGATSAGSRNCRMTSLSRCQLVRVKSMPSPMRCDCSQATRLGVQRWVQRQNGTQRVSWTSSGLLSCTDAQSSRLRVGERFAHRWSATLPPQHRAVAFWPTPPS